MKPNSDAIQMLYPPTPENIWLTDCFDETCTIGSGDYALAAGIPIEIGRLMAAAPTLYSALSELQLAVTMRPSGNGGLSQRERVALDSARAAITRATGDQTVTA